jgi:hypothetical protein
MAQTIRSHTSGHIIIENVDMEPSRINGAFSIPVNKIYCITPFVYEGPTPGVTIFVEGADEGFDVELPLKDVLDAISNAIRFNTIEIERARAAAR